MTRKLFESLADPADPNAAWDDGDTPVSPLLRALAHEGALRRAAQELADEEYHQGLWVDSEEEPASQGLRMAAQDRVADRTYSAGPWRVRLHDADGQLQAWQDAGPNGATLVFGVGSGATYVALEPDRAAALPAGVAVPETLVLIEPSGRRVVLRPALSGE